MGQSDLRLQGSQCDEFSKKMDVLQTEKDLMKQGMSEKDERIENFEEGMKIRETELIEVYRKMIEELKSRNSTNQELIISLKSQVDLQETQHDHALKQIDILKEEKESLKSTVKIKDDQIYLYEKRKKKS